jgi:NADPH:quinone reductase-like Zn-dependent oxidoreductase
MLEEAPADDRLLDFRGPLPDQEHGGIAVEALDLVLLRVAVAAVDAQGVLDHFLALRVLVQGGAGGVGVYAVQLAVILGGDVTATGRAGQDDFVRSLGARTFTEDARDVGDGFDVVVDTVGGRVLEASYGLTRRGGRLVTLSAPPSARRAEQLGIHAMTFVVTPDAAQLARLAGLTDSGRLRPVISQIFPLSEGREAFESGTRPHPPGKTVLPVR